MTPEEHRKTTLKSIAGFNERDRPVARRRVWPKRKPPQQDNDVLEEASLFQKESEGEES